MSLKQALQKRYKMIRWGYIVFCLIGAAMAVALGYHFFHGRAVVFWIYTAYVGFMTGVVIVVGLYLLAMLIL